MNESYRQPGTRNEDETILHLESKIREYKMFADMDLKKISDLYGDVGNLRSIVSRMKIVVIILGLVNLVEGYFLYSRGKRIDELTTVCQDTIMRVGEFKSEIKCPRPDMKLTGESYTFYCTCEKK